MLENQGGMDVMALARDFSYFCEGAELPGRLFNVLTYRYHGPNRQLPYQSEYGNIQFQFIVRDRMLEKQFFDNWFELMNPQANGFDFQYKSDYTTNIEIYKMIDYDNGISPAAYEMTLVSAWPSAMEAMPLSWADDSYLKLQITFNYNHYRRDFGGRAGRSYDGEPTQFELVLGATNQDTGGSRIPNLINPVYVDTIFRDKTGFKN